MNLIFDESGVAFFLFLKPLTTHISSLSCCLAINEEKTRTCRDTERSHTRRSISADDISAQAGGILFHRWNSHVRAAEEALLRHNNHSDGFCSGNCWFRSVYTCTHAVCCDQ